MEVEQIHTTETTALTGLSYVHFSVMKFYIDLKLFIFLYWQVARAYFLTSQGIFFIQWVNGRYQLWFLKIKIY